ncbi:hypothetical protein [Fluviicola sp.]|jgi:opacity protein-like surface antigen|uniref:hypothetical protein n=1 Tax=Fluviicola sp. TaxID=1917219 RepID=UPI00281CB9FD|nr:hypothetical protein [Fluviicola sp.]MDR0801248.1 hypothetical protein [Fluviicola sp.]
MKKLILLLFIILSCSVFSQDLLIKGKRGGLFSFGQRTTLSLFNGNHDRPAIGVGCQLRLQLSDRVNTEWFMDYLPATNQYTRRNDLHIGWSVMFYLLNNPTPKVQPYILAGHCFDKTLQTELANRSNHIDRWSSAVQGGIGVHFNLTSRFDVSLSSQYMIHLGTDIHSHIEEDGSVRFEKHKGGSLEGHLLTSLTLNYKLADLWKSKGK